MRGLILGVIVGVVAAWLYRSQQARDTVRERLASVPSPVRQGAQSVAAAAASAADRAASIIDSTALPKQPKDSAPVIESVAHAAPDEVLAEQDAAERAAAEARREQQSGI
jgi:gas vesicle protein